ncbi:exonuclease subunit SbcD [Flavobacterium agricola]|uniref:Nuclease SbcCD subunit D n=1 Tax=Flavobacterium agricola TaxID=2870839 RepID=A0ABY6M389_9FLAO|nr:exonuclease subunit SbcD [Flavobacterium agricola]UYW01930.1 exonuclease subunit SbcD [Flavobacterium agricola]
MKILHTADWHLGQTFFDNDRTLEHEAFLNWLFTTIVTKNVDAVLISGDVYDNSNPSNKAISMLYQFMQKVSNQLPHVQLLFTGGNHDSPLRLEQPNPLLEHTQIKIVGSSKTNADKTIRYEDLIFRLKDNNQGPDVLCIAVPFLRLGDYPASENGTYEYQEGLKKYYQQAYEVAKQMATNNEAIIAMGHLHALGIKINDRDTSERDIIGGIEMISATDFPKELTYVALGHIHKAQQVGGQNHIRYCGSPIPLSFAEKNYKHQVLLLDIDTQLNAIESIEVPVTVPLLTIPEKPASFEQVLFHLDLLQQELAHATVQPYVEVRVDISQMSANYIEEIKQKFNTINAKLVKITAAKPLDKKQDATQSFREFEYLDQINPLDFVKKIYSNKAQQPLNASQLEKINLVLTEITKQQAE